MKTFMKLSGAILFLLIVAQIMSCKKDKTPEVIASFTYQVDAVDFKKVTFTSTSQNYSKLSWNFGDNSAVSADANPVHIYAAIGDFIVSLTATSTDGSTTDVHNVTITLSDPNAELTKLVGDVSKTWKLIRDVSTGRYPLQCGPYGTTDIWWAMGKGNDDLANRPCIMNDEWTLGRDGSLVYVTNGDYWAEPGVYLPDNICASTAQMLGLNGEDLSAWGDGTHTFAMTTGSNPTLKAKGKGAFIGLCKLGNDAEVKLPQDSVTYNILALTDGTTDTLILEGQYQWDATPGGYWRFVLVHYDNPADEPPIPGPKPTASFDMTIDAMTITCTNTTLNGDAYLWDFGDGQTATSTDAVHTYGNDGFYNIVLTVTNANGSSTATKAAFFNLSSPALTDALLQGAAWKVVVGEKTIFCGPALGSSDWWSVPKGFLTGEGTGGDDWTCITDDEFTFSAGGVYTYDSKGSVRNDGYFGSPNGCWLESALTGNGVAFSSGTHSYVFTPASGTDRAIITFTNGVDRAAFIGFYKGYYGGENTDGANPPNGGNLTNRYEVIGYAQGATKEYLFVSVDYSGDHSGSNGWSAILER
jgi:PKD repeat protein